MNWNNVIFSDEVDQRWDRQGSSYFVAASSLIASFVFSLSQFPPGGVGWLGSFILLNIIKINSSFVWVFINNYPKFIPFHIPSSSIISSSVCVHCSLGYIRGNGCLIRFYDFHLSIDPGHNVNSQLTFTTSTGSDQKVDQKHQKDSIMYDTPQTNQICWPIFWPQKLPQFLKLLLAYILISIETNQW